MPTIWSTVNTTWPTWNQTWITTSATTTIHHEPSITATTSATTSGTIDLTWTSWNNALPTIAYDLPVYDVEAATRAANEVERRHEAFRTAETLLLEHLTDDQRASYEEDQVFAVISSRDRVFEITCRGIAGNIYLIDGDSADRVASYCIHPRGRIPWPDVWLMQKLLIETDEDQFMATANETRYGQRAA